MRLDASRLQLLEQQRGAAMGAAAKAERDLTELMYDLRTARDKTQRVTEQRRSAMSMDAQQRMTGQLADLERQIAALVGRIAEATAVRDAALERQQAAAQLFRRCSDFASGGGTR